MNEKAIDFASNTSEIVAGTTIVVPPTTTRAADYTQVSSVVFQSMASIAAFNIRN